MLSRGREDGASAVEFALVLLPLILILGGIIDFGFAFNAQISLTHAAREGVRSLALGAEEGEGEAVAISAYQAPIASLSGNNDVTACPDDGTTDRASITLRADYPFAFLFFLDPVSLAGQASMRCGG